MKKSIVYMAALALTTVTTLNSCIKEIDPQSSTVTRDQAAAAPGYRAHALHVPRRH